VMTEKIAKTAISKDQHRWGSTPLQTRAPPDFSSQHPVLLNRDDKDQNCCRQRLHQLVQLT
jgi:hypothetical protein